jgi:hypothetical protein
MKAWLSDYPQGKEEEIKVQIIFSAVYKKFE